MSDDPKDPALLRRRLNIMRLRVAFFSLMPIVPIIIMLFITHRIFDDSFMQRHLDPVTGRPVETVDYVRLTVALRSARDAAGVALSAAEAQLPAEAGEDEDAAAKTRALRSAFAKPASRLDVAASDVRRQAKPLLNPLRPPGFAQSSSVEDFSEALAIAKAENANLKAAIDACGCTAGAEALAAAQTALGASLEGLDDVYKDWATTKAVQPAAWMRAVNATIILIVVAGGTAFWSFAYLLPSRWGGPQYGYLSRLRVSSIVFSVLVFLTSLFLAYNLEVRTLIPEVIPVIPYRTLTLALFKRTLSLGYGARSEVFIWCNYAAIGLVAAALFSSFTAIAVASRTFVGQPKADGPASATRRMTIVRNMLYLTAALSVAVLLVIDTDFTAAASMFAARADPANPARAMVGDIGGMIVQAHGIALGLALATAYLPAAAVLHEHYQKEKDSAGTQNEGPFSILSSGIFGTVLRFIAIISPAVVGGIIQTINQGG